MCLLVGGLGYSSERVHMNGCAYQLVLQDQHAQLLLRAFLTARKGKVHALMRHSPDGRGLLRMFVSSSAKTDTNWAPTLIRQLSCRMLRNLSFFWLALQSKLSALMGLDTVLSGCTSTRVLTSWWAWIQF